MRSTATVRVLATVLVFVLAPCLASGDISPYMSYQGVLRDASGSPVPDGSYSIEFAIFNAEVSGTNLWTETQDVTTSGGIFNVYLGSVVPLDTLAWDVPYWLGLRIESEPWLAPRTPLTTVPYAAHAGYADTVLEGDTDWSIDGDNVYHETGYVGIGLATAAEAPLNVVAGSTKAAVFRNDAQGMNSTVYARNEFGTAGSFFGGEGPDSYQTHAAVYAYGHAGHLALNAQSEDQYAINAHSNDNQALHASTDNGAVCAQFDGGKVIVNDRIQIQEFYMPPGTGGYVLTSDVWGVGTWKPPAAISDGDWTESGSNIYRETGNVGIGTASAQRPLDVVADSGPCARFRNSSGATDFAVYARNEGGTAGSFYAGAGLDYYPPVASAIHSHGEDGYRGATITSGDEEAIYALSADNRALVALSAGGGQCAYFGGGVVWVDTMLWVDEFRMQPGTDGYVLTSDASGVGTWQPAAGGADGDWTISGNDMYSEVTGHVGVGANGPTAKLQVYTGADEQAFRVYHDIATTAQTASIERGQLPGANNDVLQLKVPTGSGIGFQFLECQQGDDVQLAVDGDGYIYSNSGAAFDDLVTANDGMSVYGFVDVSSNTTPALEVTSSDLGVGAKVLYAEATGTGDSDVYAIHGVSEPSAGFGYGVVGEGGRTGVYGKVSPTGSGSHSGLYGYVSGGTGTNQGVRGIAHSGFTNYGVYGEGSGGTNNYAGWFDGDVEVVGALYGGTPARRIDHPLDPANKYLVHTSVQSDEMVNVYSGNVTLDGDGEAIVEVPEWLEAVNSDFRYQLTCIGGYARVYIADEIGNGSFRIAGGSVGLKISWQVTGVCSDPAALADPLEVEVAKQSTEAGTYLNPAAYGRPATEGTGYMEAEAIDVGTAPSQRPEPPSRERNGED